MNDDETFPPALPLDPIPAEVCCWSPAAWDAFWVEYTPWLVGIVILLVMIVVAFVNDRAVQARKRAEAEREAAEVERRAAHAEATRAGKLRATERRIVSVETVDDSDPMFPGELL